jgi:K+-sensing histidine kinase KdpD
MEFLGTAHQELLVLGTLTCQNLVLAVYKHMWFFLLPSYTLQMHRYSDMLVGAAMLHRTLLSSVVLLLLLLLLQAQRHTEAAKLLVDTATKLAQQRAPPLQIKKLYVLAALEVEAFKRKALAGAGGDGATAAATLLGTSAGLTAATAAGPPGTTRGAGRTAGTVVPAQTAAAAQTLAGEWLPLLGLGAGCSHIKVFSTTMMNTCSWQRLVSRAVSCPAGRCVGCSS